MTSRESSISVPDTVHDPLVSYVLAAQVDSCTRTLPLWFRGRNVVALLVLGVLVSAGIASAATVYWTPAQMATVSPQLSGPLVTYGTGTQVSRIDGTPVCVGIGRSARGAFPGFRCAVAWRYGSQRSGRASLWVRPQAGSYCVSSIGFASCPAAPRSGDPRVCESRTQLGHYAEYCATKAARRAVDRAVREAGRLAYNLGCVPRSTLVLACDWGGGTAIVTFTLGASWRAGVVLTPRPS